MTFLVLYICIDTILCKKSLDKSLFSATLLVKHDLVKYVVSVENQRCVSFNSPYKNKGMSMCSNILDLRDQDTDIKI